MLYQHFSREGVGPKHKNEADAWDSDLGAVLENKAKAQHSWGSGLAELGKKCATFWEK